MAAVPEPRPQDELIPPPEPRTVYATGLIGAGLSAVAAALGLAAFALGESTPDILNTARLLLVAAGGITAGAAVSMRPGLWPAWTIAAVTFLLAAVAGIPASWDSGRLLANVLTGVFAVGGVLAALPTMWRLSILSLGVLFHFSGILCAVTWPDPTPWLTNQLGHRVYMPFMSFMYLRNAYHFYSPEPGPASLLIVLLTYEMDEKDPATGKPVVKHEWVYLPRRDEQMKDPLGQTYNRRLSITEMVSSTIPGLVVGDNLEKNEVVLRRRRAEVVPPSGAKEPIPLASDEAANLQYRVPAPHIARYLFPSYAKHLADEYSGPGRKVTNVKIYRIEHRVLPVTEFVDGKTVFHPATYKAYFCGDFDATGKLIDPQDEMLYWLIPVVPKPGGASPADPLKRDYIDYLSKHAGYEFDWTRMRP